MPNCRSITPETWAHARECLVFYFSRRHARSDAEDLTQETLLALWSREDYEFEKDEDFLKVCYGFARRILLEGYRENLRHEATTLDAFHPAPANELGGQRATESRLLLDEICAIGQSQLRDNEWNLIQAAAESDRGSLDRGSSDHGSSNHGSSDRGSLADEFKPGSGNKMRVRLHRARKKLAKLAGFGGIEV